LVNLFANQLTRRIVAGAQKATDSRQAAAAHQQQQQQQQAAAAAAAAAKETQQQQQQMEYWSLSQSLSSILGVVGSLTWTGWFGRCRKSRKNFPIAACGRQT